MHRLFRSLILVVLVAAAIPQLASAGSRMWIGFHDDPNFRYEGNRQAILDDARDANATIVRTLVTWATIAPTKPANPADPFDPAYRFQDLDELVRNSQARGMEALLTVWGTPKWANGGKTPNILPSKLADFTTFTKALASRYSGRTAGYPFVRFYSIWNESNLQLFLSPQFDAKGRSVGPRNYAKLAAAGYAGIKAGSPLAQVAIGETSSHGRDKKLKGNSDTHSPGRFAQLVAAANPRLKFDAWAQHPYPYPVNMKPTQKVRWPNVTLTSMPRFETSLDQWFKRKNVPVWITEYGHEVKADGEPKGVTRAQQAAYTAQAISLARADARVGMFVWFVFRDHVTSEWQSGLVSRTGAAKPALARFSSAAASVDARQTTIKVPGGTVSPAVTVYLREYGAGTKAGETVGFNVKVLEKGKLVASLQPTAPFRIDASALVTLTGFRPVKGHTYTVDVDANVYSGGGVTLSRRLTLIAT